MSFALWASARSLGFLMGYSIAQTSGIRSAVSAGFRRVTDKLTDRHATLRKHRSQLSASHAIRNGLIILRNPRVVPKVNACS